MQEPDNLIVRTNRLYCQALASFKDILDAYGVPESSRPPAPPLPAVKPMVVTPAPEIQSQEPDVNTLESWFPGTKPVQGIVTADELRIETVHSFSPTPRDGRKWVAAQPSASGGNSSFYDDLGNTKMIDPSVD
jgi:hypothetical protein